MPDKTVLSTDGNSCLCTANTVDPDGDNTCEAVANCAAHNLRGFMPDGNTNTCVCADNTHVPHEGADGANPNMTIRICAPPLTERQTYTREHCTGADNSRWTVAIAADSNNNIRESCLIPYEIAAVRTAAASELRPAASQPGQNAPGCILRQHAGFTVPSDPLSRCDHENVFGTRGLPAIPAGYTRGDRIIIANNEPTYGGAVIEQRFGAAPPPSGGDKLTGYAFAVGGVVLAGILIHGGLAPNPNALSLSPYSSFSYNHGGAPQYSYGMRLDYQNENMSGYYITGGADGNSWTGAAALKWTDENWTVGYKGTSDKDAADFLLSADIFRKNGTAKYTSGVVADYEITKTGDSFNVSWQNAAEWQYHGWQIKPAAHLHFGGENTGVNYQFGAEYRF
ncbi:MAG: hypothetical protein HAW59_00475 [Betaproteobacteria bacterium]|nr:hypothetical protein [Betaproteobacteria bacterium]